MSPTQTAAASAARSELLRRLGLPADSSDAAVEAAHEQLAAYLAEAPEELRGWAERRRTEADRIHELLTGSPDELAALGAPRTSAAGRRGFPGWARGLVAVLAVIAVIAGIYQIGKPPAADTAAAAPTASQPTQGQPAASQEPTLDQAKVAELTGRLQSDPNDVAALFDLGNAYYQADDYQQASEWYQKVIDVNPTDEKGLIALGATSFNLGDLAKAEQTWDKAAELYPTNPEVHYDLGFLYMTTRRMDQMQAAWAKVVELAPDSEFAKAVQTHVGSVTPESNG